ncbi:MAG: hypothetical protein RBR28_03740 [Lentimicrobium sp.]|jgi:hypothetical protein|nr:hypothetical protein [Lentimicrobium sp.]
MNTKNVISFMLILFGEALIILSFLYFGKKLHTEILTLNIVVSSIIYGVMFIDLIIPWINLKDKYQKSIGSIGVRWVFTFFYTLLAIGLMFAFNTIWSIDFISQLLLHGGLVFLLVFGFYMVISSSNKVKDVHIKEKQVTGSLDDMRNATKELQLKLDTMKDIPVEITSKIINLQGNLRFLSPCNTNEATGLEKKFVEGIKILKDSIAGSPLDMDEVNNNIRNCERIYNDRKHIYSN